jgi:hypothetical protein
MRLDLRAGDVGKVFLDYHETWEGFRGTLDDETVLSQLEHIADRESISKAIERAVELEIVERPTPGLLRYGPRMSMLIEYQQTRTRMSEEYLRDFHEYFFNSGTRTRRLDEVMKQRAMQFRDERLRKLFTLETLETNLFGTVPFAGPALVTLHLVPDRQVRIRDVPEKLSLASLDPRHPLLRPMDDDPKPLIGGGANQEGFLTYSISGEEGSAYSYVQVLEQGGIEAVRARYWKTEKAIDVKFRNELLEAVPRYLTMQERLGVEPPVTVLVSLVGVNGFTITDRYRRALPGYTGGRISTSRLQSAPITVEWFQPGEMTELAGLLKSFFDKVWVEAGCSEGSPVISE